MKRFANKFMDAEMLKNKLKAANSRIKVLEAQLKNEQTTHETNKRLLLEKSNHDDLYIASLKREIQKCKVAIEKQSNFIAANENLPRINLPSTSNANIQNKK